MLRFAALVKLSFYQATTNTNTSQLNKSITEGKEESFKLSGERDSLKLKLTHTQLVVIYVFFSQISSISVS